MHDYSNDPDSRPYLAHAQEGVTLCLEAAALGLALLGTGVLRILGLPFYLISILADRQINKTNDEDLRNVS